MSERTARADFVCLNCSARKRACDKSLPACGSCVKRQLLCKYDDLNKKAKSNRPYNPGKHFVASGTLGGPDTHQPTVQDICHIDDPTTMVGPVLQTIRDALTDELHKLVGFTGLGTSEISHRYFQSFHHLYPIIVPELYYQMASKYAPEDGGIPLSIDYAILILAMSLGITLPGHHRPTTFSLADQEQLYMKIKSFLAQIQTAIHPSLSLVQVTFIVAIWEYTRARVEAAYSSINVCSSLARILGIGTDWSTESLPGHSQTIADMVETERYNVAWAIAMLERIILAEMGQNTIRPLVQYPGPDCQLPADLLIPDLASSYPIEYHFPPSAPSSCFFPGDVSWFGRQAQVISLLDRVLATTCNASKEQSIVARSQSVVYLDNQIRNFLAVLFQESRQRNTTLCSAVAFSVRTLFLLHWSFLDSLPLSDDEDIIQAKNMSCAALNSACNLAIQGVTYAGQNPNAPMPICSYYLVKDAIRYFLGQGQGQISGDMSTADKRDMLLQTDKEYRDTYIF